MAVEWVQAQDTFNADLADGSQLTVTKGELLPAGHEVVKLDVSGTLFRPFDTGEQPAPKRGARVAKGTAP